MRQGIQKYLLDSPFGRDARSLQMVSEQIRPMTYVDEGYCNAIPFGASGGLIIMFVIGFKKPSLTRSLRIKCGSMPRPMQVYVYSHIGCALEKSWVLIQHQ